MENRTLTYKESLISYLRFGNGPRVAVCFHGYGEEAGSFAFLEKDAGELYTFYSIDLPFHGRTQWQQGLNFMPTDLTQIVLNILEKEGRSPDLKFSLLGFSLGGRMALRLYQSVPDRIDRFFLFAPDGLKVNFWYWLSTQTRAGNNVFAFTMKHPGWFFGLLRILNALKLVNVSIFKFVNHYIGDPTIRDLLYKRWTTLRKIRPDLSLIKKCINENKTSVRLVYGKHDRIILSSVGERFRKGIESNAELFVLHSGHKVLHEKHIGEILPLLQS